MKDQIIIAVEGFDGSGKSTIAKYISSKHGFEYHKSPSGNFATARPIFDRNTEFLDERISFYLGDCVRISNLLDTSTSINFSLDRYFYSTMAYHEAKQPGIISKYLKYFTSLRTPTLVFLIHTDFELLQSRIISRKDLNSNDSLFLNERLYHEIYRLYEQYINVPIVKISNNGDLNTVLSIVDKELNKLRIA